MKHQRSVSKDLNKPHSKSYQSQEKDGTQKHTKLEFEINKNLNKFEMEK